MHFSTAFGLAASIASAHALSSGFNYGATLTSGAAKAESDFEAEFSRAQELVGTTGSSGEFTSARLYTMIQGDTTDTPTSAIPAAINTKTSLLLGLWASAGAADFQNEVNALTSAIQQYGSSFTSLVVGISVGSEDLYRNSPTGIAAKEGTGAQPEDLVNYIKSLKTALSGTALSGAAVGHVDTWTAWVNVSNSDVITACDWIGLDAYPYFQDASIGDGKSTFFSAFDDTQNVAQGKDIWVTETGWPVSGPAEGSGMANVINAKTYWDDVACDIFGKYNTFWYTIQDAEPTTPSPSFGIIGSDLSSAPLYPLTCSNKTSSSSTSSGAATSTSASLKTTGTAKSATMPASAVRGASSASINAAPGKESAPASLTGSGSSASATGAMPYPSSNGTSPSGYGGSGSSSASGAASGAASGSAAGPTSSVTPSTGGADKTAVAGLAGLAAVVGLMAAL